MKKVIAREFIWFLFALIVAVPLMYAFMWLFGLLEDATHLSQHDQNVLARANGIGYLAGFVCIYISRLVDLAIKRLAS